MKKTLFEFLGRYISLSQAEKNDILALDIFHSFKKGTVLLKEGQHSINEYFVLQGCIRTYYIIDGEEKTTEFYTETEGIMPACVHTKAASEYYIACVEDSILIVSDSSMEAEVFEKFPKFQSLCRILTEQLIVNKQRSFDNFKISTPEQRYLDMLQHRPGLLQRIPQHQLASYLGITPQSLSRLRARISEKKQALPLLS